MGKSWDPGNLLWTTVPAQGWSLGEQKMLLTREGGQVFGRARTRNWAHGGPSARAWEGALLPDLETPVTQVTRNGENMSLEILRQKDLIGVE